MKRVPETPGDLMIQSKLFPNSAYAALRQSIPIDKRSQKVDVFSW